MLEVNEWKKTKSLSGTYVIQDNTKNRKSHSERFLGLPKSQKSPYFCQNTVIINPGLSKCPFKVPYGYVYVIKFFEFWIHGSKWGSLRWTRPLIKSDGGVSSNCPATRKGLLYLSNCRKLDAGSNRWSIGDCFI
jgi:hypothetical protein